MKYTIKGYEKKEVSIEVTAGSYEEAYKKALKKDIEVVEINGQSMLGLSTAIYADNSDVFNDAIESIKKEKSEDLELLREAFRRNKGIEYFHITFSGEGDDGQMDYTGVEPYTLQDVVDEVIGDTKIGDVLESLAEQFLEDVPVDWVNGDGGAGEIKISINDKGEFEFDVSCHNWERTEGDTFEKVVRFE